MTSQKWRISIAGLAIVAIIGLAAWYSQLTPYQRCWSDKCREQTAIAEFDAIDAASAPRIAATQRQIDEANEQYHQSAQRIQEIDRAMATLECQKKGKVC